MEASRKVDTATPLDEQVVGQLRPLWSCRWSTFSRATAARMTVPRSNACSA